jgi:CHAT domain-containing protein
VILPYVLRSPKAAPIGLCYAIWDSDQVLVADPAPGSGLTDLFGQLEDVLTELRAAGKKHICLIGPGGSRGESVHVVPNGAGILADEWLVTSVPHPMLIASEEPSPVLPRTDEILALGLGFQAGERGQDPIPDAPAEARDVAALFGAQALTDGAATEGAFRKRAPGARYLHIATHGRFSEETPSFHEVLLAPDERDDGVLYAWEIAELDLRGVEVVTLSACESASVSVDRFGNAEGLPLAFLRAGVSTVVGTLWEIETTCSRAFFELFYTALARSPSRQEAFRSALAETRRRFPDPHDWSAFFLVGDWR